VHPRGKRFHHRRKGASRGSVVIAQDIVTRWNALELLAERCATRTRYVSEALIAAQGIQATDGYVMFSGRHRIEADHGIRSSFCCLDASAAYRRELGEQCEQVRLKRGKRLRTDMGGGGVVFETH
jgi:hypothetical protein